MFDIIDGSIMKNDFERANSEMVYQYLLEYDA